MVIDEIGTMFRTTDYIAYHKYLRDEFGIKYAGPTSLNEIVAANAGLYRAFAAQMGYLKPLE